MQDDRPADSLQSAMGDRERDVLGELIRAAGRRPTPPSADYEQVRAASKEAWLSKVRSRRRRQWSYALAAGLGTLAIGVTVLMQIMPLGAPPTVATTAVLDGPVMVLTPDAENWQRIDDTGVALVSGTRLRTQLDGRVALDLARGLSLRVNFETELTFVSAEQIELTAGTVYVDSGLGVRTDRFEIATTFGVVRDIGTQFEVRSTPAELRVRVREGLVELYQDRQEPELSGSAGEEFQIDSNGAVERAPFSTYDPDWAWVSTLADVPQTDGQTLVGFLNWVAREMGRSLRFSGPGAEAQAQTVVLYGSAENLAPIEALEVMLATTDFEYELLEDGVLLIQRRNLVR